MKFYQSLQFADTGDLLPVARLIEAQTSFDGVYLGDHWSYPDKAISAYPYTSDGRLPWPAQAHWPHIGAALGAMAAATTRLRFTTGIMILPLYNPFDVARMLSTLTLLSSGRVSVGVAAGWSRDEYDSTGIDFARRGGRFDEMLDVIRLLWTGDTVEFHGAHFSFSPLSVAPAKGCPIHVGGASDRAVDRAVARGDGWISGGTDEAFVLSRISHVLSSLERAGRQRSDFVINVPVDNGCDLDYLRRLQDLGVDAVFVGSPKEDYGEPPTLAKKSDDVLRFADQILDKVAQDV